MSFISHYGSIPLLNTSESGLYKNDCLIECFAAIDEGSKNVFFINESNSYLEAMVYDTLEFIKKTLLDIWQKLFEYVSSYIINSITALKKIKNRLLTVDPAKIENVVYRTYEYPYITKLPVELKTEVSSYDKEMSFMDAMGDKFDKYSYTSYVDKKIDEFASTVMNQNLRIRNNLKDVISDTCYKMMRGKEKVMHLNKNTLDDILDELIEYKDLKSDINESRASIIEYYEKLKSSMNKVYKINRSDNDRSIKAAYDPTMAQLTEDQQQNLTFASIESNRMYNAYMAIYQTAFKCKLNIINDRITTNRNMVSSILKTLYIPSGLKMSKSEYDDNSVKIIY